MLYELLAGRRPFSAATSEELLIMQVRATPVPLSTLRPGLPPALYRLVDELMAKDPAARPASAAQALDRMRAISANLDAVAPRHEADRETFAVRDDEQPSSGYGAGPGYGTSPGYGASPGYGTGPRGTEVAFPSQSQAASEDFMLSGGMGGGGPAGMGAGPGPGMAAPGAFAFSEEPAPPPPSGPSPGGGSGGTPDWPSQARSRPRRRRRRGRSPWAGLLSTVITLAIIAGVGWYVWQKTHATLSVTSVSVAEPVVPSKCNATVQVTGIIATNGKGGTITYQWTRDPGGPSNPVTVTAGTGQDTVQVSLAWKFSGKGTQHATAQLRVLTPNAATANTQFTYSCT
jgi:hypothetical protein